jgi:hypothetical protein
MLKIAGPKRAFVTQLGHSCDRLSAIRVARLAFALRGHRRSSLGNRLGIA